VKLSPTLSRSSSFECWNTMTGEAARNALGSCKNYSCYSHDKSAYLRKAKVIAFAATECRHTIFGPRIFAAPWATHFTEKHVGSKGGRNNDRVPACAHPGALGVLSRPGENRASFTPKRFDCICLPVTQVAALLTQPDPRPLVSQPCKISSAA